MGRRRICVVELLDGTRTKKVDRTVEAILEELTVGSGYVATFERVVRIYVAGYPPDPFRLDVHYFLGEHDHARKFFVGREIDKQKAVEFFLSRVAEHEERISLPIGLDPEKSDA